MGVQPPNRRKGDAMKSMTTNDISLTFREWALRINTQHQDVLEQMRKSLDPLDRAVSKRILEVARGDTN
jgi:hypothetical protein